METFNPVLDKPASIRQIVGKFGWGKKNHI